MKYKQIQYKNPVKFKTIWDLDSVMEERLAKGEITLDQYHQWFNSTLE